MKRRDGSYIKALISIETISQFLGVLANGCPATRQIEAIVSELEKTSLSGGKLFK